MLHDEPHNEIELNREALPHPQAPLAKPSGTSLACNTTGISYKRADRIRATRKIYKSREAC